MRMSATQPNTALAAAFVSSGYMDPLTALLREAWRASPRSAEGRLAHVQRVMRDRPALLWALLERQNGLGFVRRCAEDALAAAREVRPPEMAAEAGGGQNGGATHAVPAPSGEELPGDWQWGGGQNSPGAQNRRAPSPTTLPPAATPDGKDGRGQTPHDAQARRAPAVTSQFPHAHSQIVPVQAHLRGKPAKSLKQMADEQAAAMAAKLGVEVKYCSLDTFLIDGVPIGDCDVAAVRKWAAARDGDRKAATKDVLFARSIVANLPGHVTVREYWGAADADAVYARAEQAAEASDVV